MINTVISSSVLILVILAIRFFFKGKINPLVQYGLWGLAALRLLVFNWLSLYPVESALSVMNVTGSLSKTIRGAAATDQVLAGTGQAGVMENAVFLMDNVKTGVMVSGEGISPAAAVDWQLVFLVIWLLGMAVMCAWLISVNRRFSKQLIENRTFLMFADGGLPVYTAEGLDTPCLMGYRGDTAIYVTPQVAADGEKLCYAVAHELCHYRHHDLIWSLIRSGLLAFYWFHPLVWVAAAMSKRDCELACDYEVIKEIGKDDRLAYGRALVDLISPRQEKTHILQMATTMHGSAGGIKERITMIARNKKMKASTLIAVLLIAALSAGCTFTAAEHRDDSGMKPSAGEDKTEIEAFAVKWADAFSKRDAETIYGLCENEALYLTIGGVAENGEYWMGLSSPWPWEGDYVIHLGDSFSIEIDYYFKTSSPSVYVARETVTVEKIDGEYKAVEDQWKHFDRIESKADFEEAYKYGFPDFTEFAAAYQFQADENSGSYGGGEVVRDAQMAAMEQLNISGAQVTGYYWDLHAEVNKAVVKFAWDDGEVTVDMIRPLLTDESGEERKATIWIVSPEAFPDRPQWPEKLN